MNPAIRAMEILLVPIALSPSFARADEPRAPETGFLLRQVEVKGTTYQYQVYVPKESTKGAKPPIILFLHGMGERGNDGAEQTLVGLGPAIREHPERFPAIVVMPQCRRRAYWTGDMEDQALAALSASEKEFGTDPKRVYITGLSLGGYGALAIAGKYPDRFAALVTVCGGIRAPWDKSPIVGDPYAEAAERVKRLPIWMFHGAADRTVPASESQKMHKLLKDLGADVHYTEYEGVSHNCWDRAYSDAEMLRWLFAQSKK